MPKNPDERIDSLEKSVRTYRMLSISMMVLLLLIQRNRIVSWIDKMENWFDTVASAKAS
jgi:hypothetical protein